MTERMSLDQFRDLADAYGGVVARWPERHREAAMRLVLDPQASAIVKQAHALDELLDTWQLPAASLTFRDRLVADASARARSLAVRAKLWWSGLGVAAALAGAAASSAAIATVAPVNAISESGTSFGDVAGQES